MYIHVRVLAGAKSESFAIVKELHFTAQVRQKAERNQANKRVAELVADYYRIPANTVPTCIGPPKPV